MFCKHIVEDLGSELNPYDVYVANKVINSKVYTILWWVDDIKLLHVDTNVVTGILHKVKIRFGTVKDILIIETREKIYDYLGMMINCSVPNEVKFTMYRYINYLVKELSPEMRETLTSLAAAYLFQV